MLSGDWPEVYSQSRPSFLQNMQIPQTIYSFSLLIRILTPDSRFHSPISARKPDCTNLFPAPWITTHMAIGIFDGTQSLVSPLFKALVTVLFAAGTVLFHQAYLRYGGNLKKITIPLVISGMAGTVAAVFWLAGDQYAPLKWAESVFLLLLAVFSLLGSVAMYSYLKEIALVFVMTAEEE